MSDTKFSVFDPSGSNKRKLERTVRKHLNDGLMNGFFDLHVSGSIGKNGKRVVDIRYSPNERISINPKEIEQ